MIGRRAYDRKYSLVFGIYFGQAIVCIAFVAFDVLICLLLVLEKKQAVELLEEIRLK